MRLKKEILYYERQNLIKSKQESKEETKADTNKQENIIVEKKSKKSKKTKNIIIMQNDIDDLEKDL